MNLLMQTDGHLYLQSRKAKRAFGGFGVQALLGMLKNCHLEIKKADSVLAAARNNVRLFLAWSIIKNQ